MTNDVIFLIIGFVFWYFYYGAECSINGAIGGLELPLYCWLKELSWNLPFIGWKFRLKFTNDNKEWAKQLPGPIHFILNCVILPLGPWLIWRTYCGT